MPHRLVIGPHHVADIGTNTAASHPHGPSATLISTSYTEPPGAGRESRIHRRDREPRDIGCCCNHSNKSWGEGGR